MFLCPSILLTVSMGTPFIMVTVVAKVCRATWKDKVLDIPHRSASSFQVRIDLLIGQDRNNGILRIQRLQIAILPNDFHGDIQQRDVSSTSSLLASSTNPILFLVVFNLTLSELLYIDVS